MKKKQYEIVLVDGKELRKYDDGSIRDAEGRIKTMSPERARLMQQKKQVAGMFLAGDAIREATKSETVEEGVMKMTMKRIQVALTDEGRAGNDAWRWVLQQAGYISTDKKVDVQVKHKAPPIQMDEETKVLLKELLQQRRERDHMKVIDVEAKDVSGDIYKE